MKLILLFLGCFTSGLMCDVEMNLTRMLLNPVVYDKSIRPAVHHRDATNVSFDLSLAQLIDVDEKNQIITTNQWITMSWLDPKLTWNPFEWDNISLLHIRYDKIWLPDIVLYNNADNLASLSQISTNVMVSSEGTVLWLSTGIFRSSCSIDVRYFPFDEQNCSLKFASWSYDSARFDLSQKTNIGDLSNFMANSEWEIVRLHVKKNVVKYSCCPETFPDLTYTIQMRRRPLFYVFNMILPCFLITIVAFLGFCVPSDSGEKVSIGVTTLLSMTVFLMLVADSMPPNADSLPLIGVYYLSSIVIVSIATAMSVASLNLYHYGKHYMHPVPNWIAQIFFFLIPKLLMMSIDPPAFWKKQQKVVVATAAARQSPLIPPKRSKQKPPANGALTVHRNSVRLDTKILIASLSPSDNLHSSVPLVLRAYSSEKSREHSRTHDSTNHLNRLIAESERRHKQQEHQATIAQEWQILGRVVDRLFVYVFLIGSMLVFAFILFQAPHLRLK